MEGGRRELSELEVTFSTLDWATPRTITIAAVEDDITEGDHIAVVTISATSDDEGYSSLSPLLRDVQIAESFCPPFPATPTRRVVTPQS